MDPTWSPCECCTGPSYESPMFFISYRTHTGPVWDLQGFRTAPIWTPKGIDTTWICKNPARVSYLAVQGPYGPLTVPAQAVYGLFTISEPITGPEAYNACIKSLWVPYREAKLVWRLTGPVWATWVDVRFLFNTAREQARNSRYGALGVWCDSGINKSNQYRTDSINGTHISLSNTWLYWFMIISILFVFNLK